MSISPRLLLIVSLIAGAVISRLLPHPPNFTAVGAVGLFAGASLGHRWLSLTVPLAAMFLSDLVLGLSWMTCVTYAAMSLYVVAGWWAGSGIRAGRLIAASLFGAICFFLITNFACWWAMYEHSWHGLATCYIAAIPFFQNSLLGDLTFGTALFSALKLAEINLPGVRISDTPAVSS